jgi:hypothetical protein
MPLTFESVTRHLRDSTTFAGRWVTADLRPLPDFIILGTQRGGTTSLYQWLCAHPSVTKARIKEIHYFDDYYDRSLRWYRAHFPVGRQGQLTGESSPYMLYHPLAPSRVAADLPATTRFIVLLRDPTQRAISHYWFWRKLNLYETESLERALELEPARLAAVEAQVKAGRRSVEHMAHSYVARGEYATQLRRWFDAVGRDRVLVLESERLYADPATADRARAWLGLAPHDFPFPVSNGAERLEEDPALMAKLDAHFAPHNQELFDLLGYELWTESPDGNG